MTSRRINWWVLNGAMAFVGIGLQSSSAQDPRSGPYSLRSELDIDLRRVDSKPSPRRPDGTLYLDFGPDTLGAIRKAAEELRDAEGEAKAKAEANLRELLTSYFGEDMARREKELEAMQNRLKKLQEQLAKRRDKRQEIVDLQIKVLTNEADGLGFFSNNSSPSGLPLAPERPYYFYSPRTVEEGRATIQPTPLAPSRAPATPIPTERAEPNPPREPSVAPESR